MASSSPVYDGIIFAASCGDLTYLKETQGRMGEEDFKKTCNSKTNFLGEKVLHYAARLDHLQLCIFLVEQVGLDIDAKTDNGDTPLLIAIKEGKPKAARYLIDHGADISITDSLKCTPLHCASFRENTELIKLLVDGGAYIEVDSVLGTPLHCAARFGRDKIVEFLLDLEANPNSISEFDGFTPLFNAISSSSVKYVKCVELLVKYGADVDQKVHGMSALAFAANREQFGCIEHLISAHADVNSLCPRGLTALEYAAYRKNTEVVEALFERTSKIERYPEWSPAGVINGMQSHETKEMILSSIYDLLNDVKQKAKDAMSRSEYSRAIELCNKALFYAPSTVQLFYRRCIIWGYMPGRGREAYVLHDAQECIKKKPYLVDAHFREGQAWVGLENYRMALDAYRRAWELDPRNNRIGDAYRRTLKILAAWTQLSDPRHFYEQKLWNL